MDQDSRHFKIFAECKLVRGERRSIIYDLPRNSYKLIPHQLHDILEQYEGKTVDEVKQHYDTSDHPVIDEYFDMLVDNEFIFFCDQDEVALFPAIEEDWDYPGILSNAVIELPQSLNTLQEVLTQLASLGCRHLQFRSFEVTPVNTMEPLLDWLSDKDIDHIEWVSRFSDEMKESQAKEFMQGHPRLRTWFLHSAPTTNIEKVGGTGRQSLVYAQEEKKQHTDFQVNGPGYFNVNMELFCESKVYNNYYNRKACITRKGEIKNCLSLDHVHGQINQQSLAEVVHTTDFQELWQIKKDQIEVCKVCEFRYMCVDNTPLLNKEGRWYKAVDCFYDPYKAKFTKSGAVQAESN